MSKELLKQAESLGEKSNELIRDVKRLRDLERVIIAYDKNYNGQSLALEITIDKTDWPSDMLGDKYRVQQEMAMFFADKLHELQPEFYQAIFEEYKAILAKWSKL